MVTTEIQIRFADIDMLRHVNNVTIQHYYDLGKSKYFKEVLNLDPLWTVWGFIAAATQSNYKGQIHIDANIEVHTKTIKLGNKSITIFQEIVDKNSGEVKSDSTSVMVAFDVQKSDSMPLPEIWREKIAKHEGIDSYAK